MSFPSSASVASLASFDSLASLASFASFASFASLASSGAVGAAAAGATEFPVSAAGGLLSLRRGSKPAQRGSSHVVKTIFVWRPLCVSAYRWRNV